MSDDLPVIEYGRYKVRQTPDGGWLLNRAVEICDKCADCGCGEQAEPVIVPGMLVKMAETMQHNGNGSGLSPLGMMRRLIGRGRGSGSGDDGDSAEDAESGSAAGGDLAGVSAAGYADQEGSGVSGDGSETVPGTV